MQEQAKNNFQEFAEHMKNQFMMKSDLHWLLGSGLALGLGLEAIQIQSLHPHCSAPPLRQLRKDLLFARNHPTVKKDMARRQRLRANNFLRREIHGGKTISWEGKLMVTTCHLFMLFELGRC